MADDNFRVLWCLMKGDPDYFSVTAPVDTNTDQLKTLVWERLKYELPDTESVSLALWKLTPPEPIKPTQDLIERILLRGDVSECAIKMDPSDTVLDEFPEHPRAKHIHVIVQVPPAEDYPPRKRLCVLSPWHDLPPHFVLRTNTVSALYQRLNKYQFIQVRGTPASGKTSLAQLLCQYIHQREPATHIIWIQGWSRNKIEGKGGWQNYFKNDKGWVSDEKTVFVFDGAQMSYEDGDSGTTFLNPFTSTITVVQLSSQAMARVTLRAIQHNDDIPPLGLFFTRTELDDLISKLYPSNEYHFDTSFFNAVFDVTGGHVGAIQDLITIVLAHDSYRTISNIIGQSYTWSTFLENVSPRAVVEALETSVSIFRRGMPMDHELQFPSVAHILSSVLSTGVITDTEVTTEDHKKALSLCFRNGWLHTDKLDSIGQRDVGYFFPSPLHRWYVEWKLQDTLPAIPFTIVNILELIIGVISKFSPHKLSTEQRIGAGCIQRPPEAQYQDEFYRCCHTYSNGSLLTFPEYGTAKGRVDFYIPTKQWGVELLRDGDQLAQHSGRFSSTGSYATTLPLSDYIILDCRTTKPTVAHPGLQKLHHVVFSDNFHHVCILDNTLMLVPDGEFRLLAT